MSSFILGKYSLFFVIKKQNNVYNRRIITLLQTSNSSLTRCPCSSLSECFNRILLSRKKRYHAEKTISNQRRFDVDIMLIHHLDVDVLFRRNFDGCKTDVILPCNFNEVRIYVISLYFLPRNFYGRKINTISRNFFFRHNFDGQKIDDISIYFYQPNFDGPRMLNLDRINIS